MLNSLELRAPVRIDLAGGWTDVPPSADALGGAVVNVAINRYARGHASWGEGFQLQYGMDLPPGTGLGTSATLCVLYLALLGRELPSDRARLAEAAWRFETDVLGMVGGKQDQYAAAFGGLNFLDFTTDPMRHEQVQVAPEFQRDLERRLVLVFTGESHFSSAVHQEVWKRYAAGDMRVGSALRRIAAAGHGMRQALALADHEAVADAMQSNWAGQQELFDGMCTAGMRSLIETAQAQACKATGAGAGGCLVFYDPEPESVQARLASVGAHLLPFEFDTQGITS